MKRTASYMAIMAVAVAIGTSAFAEGKPIALIGFTTDIRGIEAEVMSPGRYVYEAFCDRWPDPGSYGKYSVIYFGEKIDGEAKGKSFTPESPFL